MHGVTSASLLDSYVKANNTVAQIHKYKDGNILCYSLGSTPIYYTNLSFDAIYTPQNIKPYQRNNLI